MPLIISYMTAYILCMLDISNHIINEVQDFLTILSLAHPVFYYHAFVKCRNETKNLRNPSEVEGC